MPYVVGVDVIDGNPLFIQAPDSLKVPGPSKSQILYHDESDGSSL
jgi:hypothetical protein